MRERRAMAWDVVMWVSVIVGVVIAGSLAGAPM